MRLPLTQYHRTVWTAVAAALVLLAASGLFAQVADRTDLDRLLKLNNDGNYAEAYDGLRQLLLRPSTDSAVSPEALDTAIACLQQLNRVDEIDALREAAVKAHLQDWRLLAAVAQSYLDVQHGGYLIGGEFHRGPQRGEGKVVHATKRDRVRALQLFSQAMQLAERSNDKREAAAMLKRFAAALTYSSQGPEAWRLQSLTDLDKLPDYEEGWGPMWGRFGGQPQGAAVDRDGNPIFHNVPANWAAAKSDGERWRWLLARMVEWAPDRKVDELMIRAEFLRSQFGVETLVQYGIFLPVMADAATTGAPDGASNASDTEAADGPPAATTGIWRLTRWPKTKRLPAWPPASSDSSCPMSTITSSCFSRRWRARPRRPPSHRS